MLLLRWSMVFEVSFRMHLATIAIIVSLFAGSRAMSCKVGTNTGICTPTDLGAAADTCFQCATSEGLSASAGCLSSSTCGLFYQACTVAFNPAANFSACQASNCNACGSLNPFLYVQTPLFSFSLRGSTVILSWYPVPKPLLCVHRSDSVPFPFGSNTAVQSVLIWNNADPFAFSSSGCSGASLQPSQILSVPRPDGSTCSSEFRVLKCWLRLHQFLFPLYAV